METVRVIRIPPLRAVSSGPITCMEQFRKFDDWWSSIRVPNDIYPRDFLWYDEKGKYMEWIFVAPDGFTDCGEYAMVDFPGGLYAVAASKSDNGDDGADDRRTREMIADWVKNSGCFAVANAYNDSVMRYTMTHVITPKVFRVKMGYHLSDIYVPIVPTID